MFDEKQTEAKEETERVEEFLPVVTVAFEMFVCALTEAGKVMLFSAFLSRSTSVVFTSIITSYSYTTVGTVQKEKVMLVASVLKRIGNIMKAIKQCVILDTI